MRSLFLSVLLMLLFLGSPQIEAQTANMPPSIPATSATSGIPTSITYVPGATYQQGDERVQSVNGQPCSYLSLTWQNTTAPGSSSWQLLGCGQNAASTSGAPGVVLASAYGATPNTGTDQTSAIQSALNAAANGNVVYLGPGTYNTSAALTIPSGVALTGAGPNGTGIGVHPTAILSTSASANIFTLSSTVGSGIENMKIGRTVLPSSGSRGIACIQSQEYFISNLEIEDSYTNIYYNGCPSGYQGTYDVSAIWGQNGVSGYPAGAQLCGMEIDSENGAPMNSAIFERVGAGYVPAGTSATNFCIHGRTINDLNIRDTNSGPITHGIVINYDGSGAPGSAYDLRFNQNTFDDCSADCVQINNLPANAGVYLNDLYAVSSGSNSNAVVLNNSHGVVITGAEIGNIGNGGSGIAITGGGNNTFANVTQNVGEGSSNSGITLSNTTQNSFLNLQFTGASSTPFVNMISLSNSSTQNQFVNVVGSGYASVGLLADPSSGSNLLSNVDFTHGNISTPISDASGTNILGGGIVQTISPGTYNIAGSSLTVDALGRIVGINAASTCGQGYQHSVALSIASSKISGGSDLLSFPVLVSFNGATSNSLTLSNLKASSNGGQVQTLTGSDIIFCDAASAGNQLSQELVPNSYSPTTGAAEFYVKAPRLSSSSATQIFMFWGNANAAKTSSTPSVWSNGYSAVFHLAESAAPYVDSIGNYKSTSPSSAGNYPTQTASNLGEGQLFSGSQGMLLNNAILNSGSTATISGWVKPTAGSYSILFDSRIDPGQDGAVLFVGTNGIPSVAFTGAAANSGANGPSSIADGNYHYLAATVSGQVETLYVDGVSVATTNVGSFSFFGDDTGAWIGESSDKTPVYSSGIQEELHIGTVARSAGWIATEYANQSSPSTFLSLGTVN